MNLYRGDNMGWKKELFQLDMHQSKDLDYAAETITEAKNDDVGIVNSKSGAGILARENGILEGFADYGLGFRFNRNTQSLMVFAPNIHVFSPSIQKHEKITKNSYFQDEYQDILQVLESGDDFAKKL